jgi:hypothetical protein
MGDPVLCHLSQKGKDGIFSRNGRVCFKESFQETAFENPNGEVAFKVGFA